MESLVSRVAKHARLNWHNVGFPEVQTPPFLVLFINSICNMKCEHCFYWQNLNQRDDLSLDELVALSEELGPIQNLNLSGGEPFIRKDFATVCRQFIQKNGVKEIYCPTNAYFTENTVDAVRETLKEPSLDLLGIEISLDGMPEFHDEFRVTKNAFKKAMETYDALAEIQKEDSRLQIHSISTATHTNMLELKRLTTYIFDRCPQMTHHNLAVIRGDRKDPTLQGPLLQEYIDLYDYIKRLWAPREEGRYGSIVEPMLQHVKIEAMKKQQQHVPCRAGVLTGVVHANGDVGLCEQHPPIGNLRDNTFNEIWRSEKATKLRASIAAKECFCTNEIFMWPSITYDPRYLAKSALGAKVWQKTEPLADHERVDYTEAAKPMGPMPKGRAGLPVIS